MMHALSDILSDGSLLQRIALPEYAALASTCQTLKAPMPSLLRFIMPHKCHGLTGAGKQCSLNPNGFNRHGAHAWVCCGNHSKPASTPVFAQYVFALMPTVPAAAAAEDGNPIPDQVPHLHIF